MLHGRVVPALLRAGIGLLWLLLAGMAVAGDGSDDVPIPMIIMRSSFEMDDDARIGIEFLSPPAQEHLYKPQVPVELRVLFGPRTVQSVRIDDKPAQLLDQGTDSARFRGEAALVPGDNRLEAVVTFADGGVLRGYLAVIYDPPARIVIDSPRDWETFGALPNAPGNAGNLTGAVERPVTIVGSLSRAVQRVEINQQLAQLDAAGTAFRFERFFLHEGTNFVSANAYDAAGNLSSTTITLYVDQTAPLLGVEGFAEALVTSAARIDVRGIVNDAVEAGLNAPEPQVSVLNTSNGQSIAAQVSDRYFIALDVPLEVGANLLRVSAVDQAGNTRTQQVQATRIAAGSRRVTLLSGNRQRAAVNTTLPRALAVVAIDSDGLPLAGLPVQFEVMRGAGSLSPSAAAPPRPDGINPPRRLVIDTDAAGRAQVWLTLGSEAMEAGNQVRVRTSQQSEEVSFTATGLRGEPHAVLVAGSAGSQYAQAGAVPVEALTVSVQDRDNNASIGVPVTFRIVQGDARFTAAAAPNATPAQDGQSIVVTTDKIGLAAVRPLLGERAGTVRIEARAARSDGAAVGRAALHLIVLEQRDAPTQFGGVVLDHDGTPLAGAVLSISRTTLSARSGADGRFVFEQDVPPGKIDLFVDGRGVHRRRGSQVLEYPGLHFETAVIQGQTNQLPHPVYLPPIDRSREQIVGGDSDVRLTVPGLEGFEMVVKAHSVTFPDGSRVGPMLVTRVNNDRLPMVPPGGYGNFGAIAWTIQPTGARFDPPLQVKIPNVTGMRPGETNEIVQWDHDLATFVPMGRATVSEDGTQLVTDAGSGITKAGWGGGPPPVPPNDGDNCPPGARGEQCGCSVEKPLLGMGHCAVPHERAATFAVTSATPAQVNWNGALGVDPPQFSGGVEFNVFFRKVGNGGPYTTSVEAYCGSNSAEKVDQVVHVAVPCSDYEPMKVTEKPEPGLAVLARREEGKQATSYEVPRVLACVTADYRWAHRVKEMVIYHDIAIAGPGRRTVLTDPDDAQINSGNCLDVLTDLTPVPQSGYPYDIAPYRRFYPGSIVSGHENSHFTDNKRMIADVIFPKLQAKIAALPTDQCHLENPYETIHAWFKAELVPLTLAYEGVDGEGDEFRAYNEYEYPELLRWRNRIKERAVAGNWDSRCH